MGYIPLCTVMVLSQNAPTVGRFTTRIPRGEALMHTFSIRPAALALTGCTKAEQLPKDGVPVRSKADVTAAVAQRVGRQLLEDQQQAVAGVLRGAGGHRGVGDAGAEVAAHSGDDVHGLELPVPDVAGDGGDGGAGPRVPGRLVGHRISLASASQGGPGGPGRAPS